MFGRSFTTQRLVTQMYFPGDPLLAHDPIYHSVPDPAARERLVARFDLTATQPEEGLWATASTWSSGPCRHSHPTPTTTRERTSAQPSPDPVADRRAVLRRRAARPDGPHVVPDGTPGAFRLGPALIGPATRSPTPWPRPGRPTPTAGSPTPTTASGVRAAVPDR